MNKKLVCLQIHNDYQIPGGETKTAMGIADLLEEYGIKVIRYYKSNNDFANAGVVGKMLVGARSLYNPTTEQEIAEILKNNKVDFALVHNVMPVISNSAYAILKKRKIPIIKYIQNYNLLCLNGALDKGESCEQCKNCLFTGIKRKCYKDSGIYSLIRYVAKKKFDKNYLDYISAFMPNSNYVKEKHVQYGMDASKMYVMYNYIDGCEEKKAEFGYNSYYLYFGRISKEKGVFTVLKAFEKLKQVSLIIMGSGELEDELIEYIQEHELNNVNFIGSQKGTELNNVIQRAKCVIVSSEWDEPLPRTIMEAYAQGVPVIGANRGGIPEMIREKETGLVYKSGDVHYLKEAIGYMENLTYDEYRVMCEACLEEINNKYSQESYFLRFMECSKKILQSNL